MIRWSRNRRDKRTRRAPWRFFSRDRSSFRGALLAGVAFGRFTIQELTDQILQHHRRLRDLERVAGFQVLVIPAGSETDVLLAKQPGSEDLRSRVQRELVTAVQGQSYDRLE